jgi:hypothetical protein
MCASFYETDLEKQHMKLKIKYIWLKADSNGGPFKYCTNNSGLKIGGEFLY